MTRAAEWALSVLAAALAWLPVWGLPIGVLGAAAGAATRKLSPRAG